MVESVGVDPMLPSAVVPMLDVSLPAESLPFLLLQAVILSSRQRPAIEIDFTSVFIFCDFGYVNLFNTGR
jgi:hypothetical protein